MAEMREVLQGWGREEVRWRNFPGWGGKAGVGM